MDSKVKQKYNVLVITLKSAKGRQEKARSILQKAELDFEFLYGVDGRLEHELLDRMDDNAFLRLHGRPALAGEAGCYASHYLAWSYASRLKQPTIILEDDFVLKDNAVESFLEAVKLMERHKIGFIRLEGYRKNLSIKIWSNSEYSLIRFFKIPQSLTGYMISPQAAVEFMKYSDVFTLPVDYFMKYMFMHKQPIYALEPAALYPDKQNLTSIIGDRKNLKGAFKYKISRQLFRLKGMFLNGIYNLKFLKKDIQIKFFSKPNS